MTESEAIARSRNWDRIEPWLVVAIVTGVLASMVMP